LEENCFIRLKDRNIRICNSREIFARPKKEFGRGGDETMKVAELKKVKQESRIIEDFVQEFRRAARESKYKERPLMEGFKCYNLRTLEWIQRSNSCIREDTRELNKELFTK